MEEEKYYTVEEVQHILGYKRKSSVINCLYKLYHSFDSIVSYGRGEHLILKEWVVAYQEQEIQKYYAVIGGKGRKGLHPRNSLFRRFYDLLKKDWDSYTITFNNLTFTLDLIRKNGKAIDLNIKIVNKGGKHLPLAEKEFKKHLISMLVGDREKINSERLRKDIKKVRLGLSTFTDVMENIESNFNGMINYKGRVYSFANLQTLKQLVADIEHKERICRVAVYNENWNLTRYKAPTLHLFNIEDIHSSSLKKGIYHVKTFTNSGVEKYYRVEKIE